jgi:phage nucleotide-binding protein
MSSPATTLTTLTERTVGGLKILPVQERKPYFNMLVYGDPGVGKTVLCGSAAEVPEMAPVLFIDVEGGTFSLRAFYPDIDVVRVESMKDMQKVYDELYRGTSEYKTVVLDSLTEIQKFSMGKIMEDVVAKEPDRDPDIPSVREWGKNIEQTRKIVRGFRDLPMNVIFTALANSDKDQKTGKTTVRPYLSGKLANEVAGFMDIVSFLYVKVKGDQLTRLMLTRATETHVSKDRSNRLPPLVEEPTMAALHAYIAGNKKPQPGA